MIPLFLHFLHFLQLRGMYIARQLSFSGVTFAINEVPLAEKVIEMYDASVELVRALHCLLQGST